MKRLAALAMLAAIGCESNPPTQAERLQMRVDAKSVYDTESHEFAQLSVELARSLEDQAKADQVRAERIADDKRIEKMGVPFTSEYLRSRDEIVTAEKEADARRHATVDRLQAKVDASHKRVMKAKAEFESLRAD